MVKMSAIHLLGNVQVDFFNKKNTTTDPFDTDQMAKEFSMQFPNQVSHFPIRFVQFSGPLTVGNPADSRLPTMALPAWLADCNAMSFVFVC